MLRRLLRSPARFLLSTLVVGSAAAFGCSNDFDTSRPARPTTTLGDDLYSTMCDRVAATEQPEDLELRWSRGVCHMDENGAYANDYADGDGDMPPKVAVMVRYRTDLIAAFNATFPDDGHLHDDLVDLMKSIVPLYDDDTVPESTRTLAAIFDAIAYNQAGTPGEDPDVKKAREARNALAQQIQTALARLGGRQGYRAVTVGVGAAKPVLAYPKLSDVVDTTIKMLGPGGDAEAQFRKVLEVTQAELNSTIPSNRVPLTGYSDRFSGQDDYTPKLTSEVLRNLLVDDAPAGYPAGWTNAYARVDLLGVQPSIDILVRDPRGFAAFNSPPSTLAYGADGLPKVDAFGRFVDDSGNALAVATPFAEPLFAGKIAVGKHDPKSGKAIDDNGDEVYLYRDARNTFLHSMLLDSRDIVANGALLDAAHGATYLLGPRTPASDPNDPTTGSDVHKYVDVADGAIEQNVSYRKFDGDKSPLTDLVYAFGRFLEYPKARDYLDFTKQLVIDHPTEVARVIGASMAVRAIATKPEYASVMLDVKSGLWDDMLQVAVKIAQEPDLMRDVLDSLADPDVLLLDKGMSSFYANKDQLDYDPAGDKCWAAGSHPDSTCPAINNPSVNTTTGKSLGDPSTPVDLTTDDTEDNRSLFQRFGSLIHDSSGVAACNRQGATIDTKINIPVFGNISVTLPPFGGSYNECAVLNVPDLAIFYVGCIAGGTDEVTGHARCELPISDTLINDIKSITGTNFVDNLLESSSGITGLRSVPTVQALNRLVFWRNPNKFITDLTDPVPTAVCPVTNAATGHRTCASQADLMMNRQKATIFMGEYFSALQALRPVVTPFVKRRGADKTSRAQYFVDLVNVLHRHWSTGNDPTRCKPGAATTDPAFCYGDNGRQYEKLISEVFATDLVPALNALQKVVMNMKVNGQNGDDIMTSLVADLLDPNNAKGMNLTNRDGSTGTVRNDGGPIDQVTPFYLFANALNLMDASWVGANGAKDHATWQGARSKLVDQFLSIDAPGGDTTKSAFHNPGVYAALPLVIDLIEDRMDEHEAAGDFSDWTHTTLVKEFNDSISGPLVASIFDLQEKIYANTAARSTLQSFLAYLANQASSNDALATVVTTTQDLMQVINDEQDMVAVYHLLATGAAPDGASKRGIDLLDRVNQIETSDDWVSAHDGRRVMPKILANLVTPMGQGKASPFEIFVDCVDDIHRADPTASSAFAGTDYGSISGNVESFLTDPTRGLEQFYTIVKNRKLQ